MLDFPAPPLTIGQLYNGTNGVTYRWSGTIWVATGASAGGDFYATQNLSIPMVGTTFITMTPPLITGSGGFYNVTNGRYTPPAGRYYLHADVSGNTSAATTNWFGVQIRKNGVVVQDNYDGTGSSWYGFTSISVILDANGSDWFDAQYACMSTTTTIDSITFLAFPISGIKGPPGDPATCLPLTGGTLTGPLTGTTATFSGGMVSITAATNPVLNIYNSTVGGFGLFCDTGASGQMTIYRTGTTGGWIENYAVLNATSATFSKPVIAPGAQIQMVSFQTGAVATGTTVIPLDDTIPQITEGDQYMTLAITPRSATSRLIIEANVVVGSSVANFMAAALFQDATANALAVNSAPFNTASTTTVPLRHVMTSGTTSTTTFRIRAGGTSAGTTTFNGNGGARLFGGVYASSIVIQEVAP